MKITNVTIVEGLGADKVMLQTDLPEACYPYTNCLTLDFSAAAGSGVDYVRKHFGIEPEVVKRAT